MIVVVGLSHRTAPVEVRERLAVAGDQLQEILDQLLASPSVGEALVLSTCNRVEVMAAPAQGVPGALNQVVEEVQDLTIARGAADSAQSVRPHLYSREGKDAIRHLFRVASSLDSMVVGEPQILGQLKEAYESALQHGAVGPTLKRVISSSFHAAKRVRTETAIGAGVVSVSSVAVDLAHQIFGDLDDRKALLVGAGTMAEEAAQRLKQAGARISVCNRSPDRAARLAAKVGGQPEPWEGLEASLVEADVVVSSTAKRGYVLTHELMQRVMRKRRGETLFLIDIAVPRDIAPSVNKLDGVFCYNVDDLESIVMNSLEGRQTEARKAEGILDHELGRFDAWLSARSLTPTIVALRNSVRGTLQGELQRALSGKLKHLDKQDIASLQAMMDASVNKLLHRPVTHLKRSAQQPEGEQYAEALRALFDLPDMGIVEKEPKKKKSQSGGHLRLIRKENTPMELILATRRSKLALAQARAWYQSLLECHEDLAIQELHVVTTGDRITDRPLQAVGGKGLFLKEIEEALMEDKAQLAVHSLKDIPATLAPGLELAAFPLREDPRDALICREAAGLASLPEGAVVGTGSLRRQVAVRRKRPDLRFIPMRGNIDTRLRKLEEGQCDAIVLANAGLKRMGLEQVATEVLSVDDCLPAVGQGALAIETKAGAEDVIACVRATNDELTELLVACERGVMVAVEGNCQIPVAAYAELLADDQVRLRGMLADADGSNPRYIDEQSQRPESPAAALIWGQEVGKRLRVQA